MMNNFLKPFLLFVIPFLLLQITSVAQESEFAYRIYFKDKPAGSYNLSNPQDFFSLRAIERRTKYSLPIDSSDLPVYTPYINQVVQISNGKLHNTSKWHNTAVVILQDTSLINAIRTLPFVQQVKWVAYYPQGFEKPASPTPAGDAADEYSANYYGYGWAQIHLCEGEALHYKGLKGEGMLIALIDMGYENVNTLKVFDSLRLGNRIIDSWNFARNKERVVGEGTHGTQVLSCIAGNLPDEFVGVAPKAMVALYTSEDIRSEQPIEQDNWLAAAERADSIGADVITTSLGYNTYDGPFVDELFSGLDGKTTFIARGANKAVEKGILVFSSAGNEGTNNWEKILTPGDADSVLTVGAVTAENIMIPFSGYGPNASGTIKPDVVAMGGNVNTYAYSDEPSSSYGTSFATPIIAGLTTCLLQQDPTKTPYQIKNIVRRASDHYLLPENQRGYGLPNFSKALDLLSNHQTPENEKENFVLFPNPVNTERINLLFPEIPKGEFEIDIITTNGKRIWSQKITQLASNVLSFKLPFPLAKGNYLFVAKIENKPYKYQFVVN